VGTVKITTNADKVARQIRAYAGQLQSKYSKALERIAELGGGTARVKFANALYAGDNDVIVDVKRVSATKYQVIASGKTVLFIEFGTGVAYPELVEPNGLTYIHGTYGKFKGLNPNGWAYVGEQGNLGIPIKDKDGVFRTKGNPPARAMYDASKDMRAEITRIFREEFQYK
jgi:hypothetical protein